MALSPLNVDTQCILHLLVNSYQTPHWLIYCSVLSMEKTGEEIKLLCATSQPAPLGSHLGCYLVPTLLAVCSECVYCCRDVVKWELWEVETLKAFVKQRNRIPRTDILFLC